MLRPAIRPATLADRSALLALQWRASLATTYREALLRHPRAIELPVRHIEEGSTLVAVCGGVIAGFAVLLPHDAGAMELDGLFVEPRHFRRGIGRRLVEEAAARAAAQGGSTLLVVAAPEATGFYCRCGFEPAGEVATRFGPALAMRRRLASASTRR